jgi:hypothetical protein
LHREDLTEADWGQATELRADIRNFPLYSEETPGESGLSAILAAIRLLFRGERG